MGRGAERARRASEWNRVAPPWGTGPALLCCLCPWAQPDPTSGPNGNKDGAVPAEAEAPPRRRETAPHGRGRGAGGRLEQTQVLRMFRVAQGVQGGTDWVRTHSCVSVPGRCPSADRSLKGIHLSVPGTPPCPAAHCLSHNTTREKRPGPGGTTGLSLRRSSRDLGRTRK